MSDPTKKYHDALDKLSKCRRGIEKHQALWEILKDHETREKIRVAVDPNLQTAPKDSRLHGIGVVTLNRVHAGLVKRLRMATPATMCVESYPDLWHVLLKPVEKWAMVPIPASMRCILGVDGVARNGSGFLAKFPRGYAHPLEGVLTIPGISTPIDYYRAIRAGNVKEAKFTAWDAIIGTQNFLHRRKYIEGLDIECLPVIEPSPLALEALKPSYAGAAFRRKDKHYFLGDDQALIACHFAAVVQANVEHMRKWGKAPVDIGP